MASYPRYLSLHETGELHRRSESALWELAQCSTCPRRCGVDRLRDERQACHIGRFARVASHFPHHGEEDCLRGKRGSGTVFFGRCNLHCVFCQNADISQRDAGQEMEPGQLAGVMLELQEAGCHNLNLVTPEHVVPQILEALPLAIDGGLRLPIVYNTSAYDSRRSLRLLDGIVDIYMPDLKFLDEGLAERYLHAPGYPEAARQALVDMHRQVGALQVDDDGLARQGVLVRHLVMPGHLEDTARIMRFLAEEVSPDTYVNIMGQYRPAWQVGESAYAEIDRPPTPDELLRAYDLAREAGLHRFDERR
ncbi:radical SAM protein [Candidatus Latescibacterota bacterium]